MTCPRKEVFNKAERRRLDMGAKQDLDKKLRLGARWR